MQMSCSHKSLVNWNKLKLHFIISLYFKVDSIHCELQMNLWLGIHSRNDVKGTGCQLPMEILPNKATVLYSKNIPLFIISKEHFPHAVRPPANYIANCSLDSLLASRETSTTRPFELSFWFCVSSLLILACVLPLENNSSDSCLHVQ